jgi:hypothetical protein
LEKDAPTAKDRRKRHQNPQALTELLESLRSKKCAVRYAKAKPKLAVNTTRKLLSFERTQYKHRKLVQANALRSFSEYFDQITSKEQVFRIARELQKNRSSRAKKEAAEFFKKHPP